MWERIFGNLQTTIGGLVLGAATYIYGVGGKLPTSKEEIAYAAAAVILGTAGAVVKNPSLPK